MLDKKPKTVGDLMTRKIIAANEDDSLANIEESMERFRFRHLPVVDGEKLIGLVTHRDLLHASSSFFSDKREARDQLIHSATVGQLMQREVLTVRPDEPLVDAAKLMWEAKVGSILVTDKDDKLLGIVTEADFIRLSIWFLEDS